MDSSVFTQPAPQTTTETATTHKPRNIILCFDGTGNKFGENSNVVRFFHSLIKDEPDRQLVYYQPGIGTYNQRKFFTTVGSSIASTLDSGLALHLHDHVKEGYQYIMRNYRKGDRISLFGFSRGAHTARVVAGMLYKVGILPAHNDQQLDFAFSVYQMTGDKGYDLSKEFKQTFAMPATVQFVGVWDTVSSVGIIPQSHPYTSVNYAVKHFRHALALDERRARFRPNVWNEPTLGREQELDIDEPIIEFPGQNPGISRDDWVYTPPDRDVCDVQEVWFAGCHADVGGGSHSNQIQESLSYIPLRWMIKECLLTGSGVLFDLQYLKLIGINLGKLYKELEHKKLEGNLDIDLDALGFHADLLADEGKGSTGPTTALLTPHKNVQHADTESSRRHGLAHRAVTRLRTGADVMAEIFDQLVKVKWWWGIEVIPTLATYQQADGDWVRKRMRNFGQGRYIPFHDDKINVHVSVKIRQELTKYTPSAYNWDDVRDSDMLIWVGDEADEKEEGGNGTKAS
ncbi:hypothetical protein DXG03_005621 [Asterophora parasitica]|uniref:T6SS Phospholipase effector Tle1-like catalytic domain-containing protein n=1 Tax=Asterophora parasitica TaxID=117018 RepID=A0A9P7KE83_9AGAR|nr:hypothetical protein DXG03_005621 [Asterophora parasitica]